MRPGIGTVYLILKYNIKYFFPFIHCIPSCKRLGKKSNLLDTRHLVFFFLLRNKTKTANLFPLFYRLCSTMILMQSKSSVSVFIYRSNIILLEIVIAWTGIRGELCGIDGAYKRKDQLMSLLFLSQFLVNPVSLQSLKGPI